MTNLKNKQSSDLLNDFQIFRLWKTKDLIIWQMCWLKTQFLPKIFLRSNNIVLSSLLDNEMFISTNGLQQLLRPGYNLETISGFADIYSATNRLFSVFLFSFQDYLWTLVF